MKVEGQGVLLSASDLMPFMSRRHATTLDLRYARGEALLPAHDTEDVHDIELLRFAVLTDGSGVKIDL